MKSLSTALLFVLMSLTLSACGPSDDHHDDHAHDHEHGEDHAH